MAPSQRKEGRRVRKERESNTLADNSEDDTEYDISERGGEHEIYEDEETTRCICGFQDYPGAPVVSGSNSSSSSKARHSGVGSSCAGQTGASIEGSSEERGSLFIQCDQCKVWQHGGCVGIMSEASCPDEYFCEECRVDLHYVCEDSNGQKYSQYLPIQRAETSGRLRRGGASSRSRKCDNRTWSERAGESSGKMNGESGSTKRRSTLNSQAAYDEDEVLRKVIEESKFDAVNSSSARKSPSEDGINRKTKRGREDSDEVGKTGRKRSRANSRSTCVSSSSNHESLKTELEGEERKVTIDRESGVKRSSSCGSLSNRNEGENSGNRNEDWMFSGETQGGNVEGKDKVKSNETNMNNGNSTGKSKSDENGYEAVDVTSDTRAIEEVKSDSTGGGGSVGNSNGWKKSRRSMGKQGGGQLRKNGSNMGIQNEGIKMGKNNARENCESSEEDVRVVSTTTSVGASNEVLGKDCGVEASIKLENEACESPVRENGVADKADNAQMLPNGGEKCIGQCLNGSTESGQGTSETGNSAKGNGTSATSGNGNSNTGNNWPGSRRKGREKHGLADLKRRATFMLEYISRVQIEMAQRAASIDAAIEAEGDNVGGRQNNHTLDQDSRQTPDDNIDEKDQLSSNKFSRLSTTEMMDNLTRRLVLWQQQFR